MACETPTKLERRPALPILLLPTAFLIAVLFATTVRHNGQFQAHAEKFNSQATTMAAEPPPGRRTDIRQYHLVRNASSDSGRTSIHFDAGR